MSNFISFFYLVLSSFCFELTNALISSLKNCNFRAQRLSDQSFEFEFNSKLILEEPKKSEI